ncbi:MAG: Protein transport protein Sec16B [Chrysothrix sp. TS-e1954]|nr:MAG: Protein transport protein Sec16B [Chrysothrix sp. TS-e1954]
MATQRVDEVGDVSGHSQLHAQDHDRDQDPYDNWVSSLNASSEVTAEDAQPRMMTEETTAQTQFQSHNTTQSDGSFNHQHLEASTPLESTTAFPAMTEYQHGRDESFSRSRSSTGPAFDAHAVERNQQSEAQGLRPPDASAPVIHSTAEHHMSPSHYEFPTSATHGEFEPVEDEKADTATAIAELDDWAKHAESDAPPHEDIMDRREENIALAEAPATQDALESIQPPESAEEQVVHRSDAFEPLAVDQTAIGQMNPDPETQESFESQLPEESASLLQRPDGFVSEEQSQHSKDFSASEAPFNQMLSQEAAPLVASQLESLRAPSASTEHSKHIENRPFESSQYRGPPFDDSLEPYVPEPRQTSVHIKEESNPFQISADGKRDEDWLSPIDVNQALHQEALMSQEPVGSNESAHFTEETSSNVDQAQLDAFRDETLEQQNESLGWDAMMTEQTNEDDPWAKAFEPEPRLEDAFAEAFDDEGLLEDEPAQMTDQPLAQQMSQQSVSTSYAPAASTVTNTYQSNQGFADPSVQYSQAPQYGNGASFIPPPAVKGAGPAKPMQFFEDLPSIEPPKRKTRQMPPQDTRGPPPPSQPQVHPPQLPPQQSQTSVSQLRAPDRLDPFPPQTGADALAPAATLQKPPQTNARYSPAPQQRGPSPRKYSTSPSRPTPPQTQRYSPAPSATSQGGAMPNGFPQSRPSTATAPRPLATTSFQGDELPVPRAPRDISSAPRSPMPPPRSDSRQSSSTPSGTSTQAPPPPNRDAFFSELPPDTHPSHSHAPPHSAAAIVSRFAPRTSSPLVGSDARPTFDRSVTQPLPRQDSLPETELTNHLTESLQRPGTATSMPPPITAARIHQQSGSPAVSSYTPPPNAIPPLASRRQFAAPPRPRTQSPEASRKAAAPAAVPIERPRSAEHHHVAQTVSNNLFVHHSSAPKAPSATDGMDFIPPEDTTLASDPLRRWHGAPIFRWSAAGSASSMFPIQHPRYGGGQSAPAIKSLPGIIKVRKVKEAVPVDEGLVSFPGPLKSKSKKKEVLTWLSARIETLQQEVSLAQSAAMDPRPSERLLLWRMMRLLVEHDGMLTGNTNLEATVKQLIAPNVETMARRSSISAADMNSLDVKADAVNPQVVQAIRAELTKGDREKAVWQAADHRLWGHAMLIASTMSSSVWKQVSQEFVKKEVRAHAADIQSLAALYEVFAGNADESIDELVPVSARAGFQMMTAQGPSQSRNTLDGLNKWRETLSLVLSNRSTGDEKALVTLGKLLKNYGRIEAAHVCFLFARTVVHLGGIDDVQADFTLIGANLSGAHSNPMPDIENVLLSEIYEYAFSLSPSASSHYVPHLQSYKLYHAHVLAEQGQREKALAYCEAIATAMKATTRSSPYFHSTLVWQLDDLTKRLTQAPKDSSSWISKPSIGKVGGGVWAKLEGFIAGEENDAASTGSNAPSDHDVGRFAPYGAGTPPTVSRSHSVADLTGSESNRLGPSAASNSRYAPHFGQSQGTMSYSPRQQPLDATHNPYEARHAAFAPANASYGSSPGSNSYMPQATSSYSPAPSMASTGNPQVGSYQPQAPPEQPSTFPSYNPPPESSEPSLQHQGFDSQPQVNGYLPPAMNGYVPETQAYQPSESSYEPPTSSYEPPTSSYQSYEPTSQEPVPDSPEKPRRKQMFDEDEDDAALKAQSRAQRDRENDELFKKAAEADAAAAKDKAAAKKSGGWGFPSLGLFGGKKDPNAPTVHKVKLGEENKFVYDEAQKRWVNKAAGATQTEAAKPAPPPPRAAAPPSRTASAMSGAPSMGVPTGSPAGAMGMPPMGPSSRSGTPASMGMAGAAGTPNMNIQPPSGPPSMAGSGPPSRPPTSMSTASSKPAENLDDLLDSGGPSRAGKGGTLGRKKKGGARYVDTMAK